MIETIKGRKKFVAALDHFEDLDEQYAKLVPPNFQTADHIQAILKNKGAPEYCHVTSSNTDLDDREMPLREALREIVGKAFGTVVSCVAGKLGYFEGEEENERFNPERI